MRLSPLAAVAAACVLTLTACGDDGSDPESSDNSESPSASPTDGSGKDKGKDKGKTELPKKPKKVKMPDLGDATICEALDADAVGEVIDAKLKRGPVRNNTCVYADPKNPSGQYVGVGQVTVEAAGGSDAVAGSLTGLVDGEPEEVADLGDQAYVAVGATPAGTTAAAGVVVIDDAVVSVGLPVGTDQGPDDAKEQVVELLELVDSTL